MNKGDQPKPESVTSSKFLFLTPGHSRCQVPVKSIVYACSNIVDTCFYASTLENHLQRKREKGTITTTGLLKNVRMKYAIDERIVVLVLILCIYLTEIYNSNGSL